MINVALIHPDYTNKVYETLSVPLGLAWISSCINTSPFVNVDCYDFAKNPEMKELFDTRKYSILFIQLHSQETLGETIKWISKLKEENSSVIIVVGGIAVELDIDKILSYDFIDVASLGDGEYTSLELCEAIARKESIVEINGIAYKDSDGQIIKTPSRTPISDLDSLPLPDREAFGLDYPQWSIITARGCPYKCKFCSMPKIHNNVRYRSMKKVAEEIFYLYDNYKMRKFFMVDDTFTIERNRVIELCTLLINDKRKVEWTCVTRADRIDYEILEIMKRAGCIQISCGIESANNDIQEIIGKNLDISTITENLLSAKQLGIRVRCSFIFGLPGETDKHILNSLEFMKKVKPNEIQIYPYVPYNGTEFMDRPQDYGIKTNSISFKNKKNLMEPFVELYSLSKSDIVRLSLVCIEELRSYGYLWIPGDVPARKNKLEYVVMTEFAPVQTLC